MTSLSLHPLNESSGYLKAPDSRLPPLLLSCNKSIARDYEIEDVQHVTSLAEPV